MLMSTHFREHLFKTLIKDKFRNTKLHNRFKIFKSKLRKTIQLSKRLHFHQLLKKSKNNTKNTWNIINKIVGKNKKPISLPNKLKLQDNFVLDKQLIANKLNSHFATIGENSNCGQNNIKEINKTLASSQKQTIVLIETREEEVERVAGIKS